MYALSTCGWCKKTKAFFRDNGISFEYIDVDKSSSEEKREIIKILKEKKIPLGFPVTFIDDEKIIRGFKPDELKEVLGL
jgi:glutaredoxin